LGNPFCAWYPRPEDKPKCDAEGWSPLEHERLCAAFRDYLAAVLAQSAGEEQRQALVELVREVGDRHGLIPADSWLVQHLQRSDVLSAFERLQDLVSAGVRLRLLCHCRPHVRCHVELLKQRLDEHAQRRVRCELEPDTWAADFRNALRTPPSSWPTAEGGGPKCAQCGRQARAMDPGTRRVYCCFCWMDHADRVAWRATDLAKQRGRQGRTPGSS